MKKIAIIGDRDTVLPFNILGIDTYIVNNDDLVQKNLKNIIDKLVNNKYYIIFITEEYSIIAKESIDYYKNNEIPMITIIPAINKNLNIGINNISKNMEKAIGKNIF